jgi:Ca2+-binding EF-hand superfamily protein
MALCPDVFTELEETRLKELFDRLDADHDGFITHHDVRRLCLEFGKDLAEERALVSIYVIFVTHVSCVTLTSPAA